MQWLTTAFFILSKHKLARVKPGTVSLTAFNHLTSRSFLQGVSLTAKSRFVN